MENKKNVASNQLSQTKLQMRAPKRLQTAEGWKRDRLKKNQQQKNSTHFQPE